MLSPERPPQVSVERAELAGYKALHGTCRSATPTDAISPSTARFQVDCERGAFELDISISSKTGLITGFHGTSREIAAPPALRKPADAIAALSGRWDAGLHQRARRHQAIAGRGPQVLRGATRGSRRLPGQGREARVLRVVHGPRLRARRRPAPDGHARS
jgi:hypothetical protein